MPKETTIAYTLDPALAGHLAAARAGDHNEFSVLAEPYRRELQVHCYRILGSLHDAEDLVQETMLRAWRRLDTFEGRASLRAWLYKIATNACLDALDKRPRRALPPATHPPADPRRPLAPPVAEPLWLEPLPDDLLAGAEENPEARYTTRESITLAFLAALQTLPPRQRAAVILCDVLDWKASEAAECLGATPSAVNSALHRARETLAKKYHRRETMKLAHADERTRALLDRFMRAWETADVNTLVSLLKDEATLAMPPTPSWYRGPEEIRAFLLAVPLAGDAQDRWRLILTQANGGPAFAFYQRDDSTANGLYRSAGVMTITLDEGAIFEMTLFTNPELVLKFGLPPVM
ncbi:MAG: sigma-70 family RNA polymerase sigma factor [Chloroflexi bacterium]|nr:sigma-70 family RNA polymerase sigma factor [Chloroflexota bacterium]